MIYEPIKTIKEDLSDLVLRRGQTATFGFDGKSLSSDNHHRLYFTCEDRMHFALKDEPQTDKLYMLIDDSLDTEHANTRRYCLNLSCDTPKEYPKRAIAKIMWPPKVDSIMYNVTDEWQFGIFAKAEGLRVSEGGFLRICLERWEKKPGIPPALTREEPDEVTVIDLPEGTYDYTALTKAVTIPNNTACVLVIVEGLRYEGTVYLEEPMLVSSTGKNACPDFDLCVPGLPYFTWVGQSLSKKEWPVFSIAINGREIFRGETFLRIHRYPSVELEIPDDLVFGEENELTITYLSDYHDVVPLSIRECMILARPKEEFTITYCPKIAARDKDICVLLRTERDGLSLRCESRELEAVTPLVFAEKGLHAVRFRIVGEPHNHMLLTLSSDTLTQSAEILQVVTRGEDGVICGSADLIYIDNSDLRAVEDYLEWFFSLEMGDLVTIRPAYRWGGHRTIEPRVWHRFCELCRGMGAKYAHMLDGRDLPAIYCNPHPDMLRGEGFLGRQIHERDGQLFYWGYPAFETMAIGAAFWDLTQRLFREMPLTGENTYRVGNVQIVNKENPCLYRNLDCDADMKEAHSCAIESLRTVKGIDNTRHTGPSVMFKYLYEAGFDWLGFESLDSSMEAPLAFLRGAAKAYGVNDIGVHQALQWSTHPHDTEPRYRRFLLALYTVYMQGVHQINLEEGFWHLECGFVNHHRFSDACTRHREHEVTLTRFVRSHTRSGRFYTPIAFLHGRYDGWNGFSGGGKLFGMPHMMGGEAEASWSLLHLFYPKNNISVRGMTVPKYPETPADDKPRGMYTGTPRGNVDVMPVELGDYSDYKMLAFLGYNAADERDFDRLYAYVREGGTLLGAWPHFSYTTRLEDIQAHRHRYLYHPLTYALTDGKRPMFETRTLGGKKLSVCVNLGKDAEVLERTDDGTPLAVRIGVGKGSIMLVNAELYPANEIIRPIYERLIAEQSARFSEEEPSIITCGEDVQYTVFLQENGDRHYYITPVDWYNDPTSLRHATLRVGEYRYELSLPFGKLYKIVTNEKLAAWTEEDSAEVLEISDGSITVQGVDRVTLRVAKDGRIQTYTVDCTHAPCATVVL